MTTTLKLEIMNVLITESAIFWNGFIIQKLYRGYFTIMRTKVIAQVTCRFVWGNSSHQPFSCKSKVTQWIAKMYRGTSFLGTPHTKSHRIHEVTWSSIILGSKLRREDLQTVVDKVITSIASWKGRLLSYARRLTWLKACLASIPIYHWALHVLANSSPHHGNVPLEH